MANTKTELNGIAFLAFEDQVELLFSELKNRFNFTQKPSARYGDLIYFENNIHYKEVFVYVGITKHNNYNELVDMIHYIVAIASLNGIDLNDAIIEKDKKTAIKYNILSISIKDRIKIHEQILLQSEQRTIFYHSRHGKITECSQFQIWRRLAFRSAYP